jgi:hypothetical protein
MPIRLRRRFDRAVVRCSLALRAGGDDDNEGRIVATGRVRQGPLAHNVGLCFASAARERATGIVVSQNDGGGVVLVYLGIFAVFFVPASWTYPLW